MITTCLVVAITGAVVMVVCELADIKVPVIVLLCTMVFGVVGLALSVTEAAHNNNCPEVQNVQTDQ